MSYCSPEKTISKAPPKHQKLFVKEGIFPLQWPSLRIAKHPVLQGKESVGCFAKENIDKFRTVSIYSGAVVSPQIFSKYGDFFDLQNWQDACSCKDRKAYSTGNHASFFNLGYKKLVNGFWST
ncbi:MAG: hypothetical protein JSR80_06960 [Verrucomicrobia bacterium]|nr:hypothetical protein [Verrucomicrobiota bacterium]